MNYVKTLTDQLNAMLKAFIQHIPSLTISLVVLVLTWLLAKSAVRIADRLTKNSRMRENLKQLIETVVRIGIWVFGLLLAATISMPGLTPASLFAGLGVSALAIGFAFQDIFENFLAGVLIMVRDRMRIGDTIECQHITGKIERITLRESHVRAPSNELTIVPNSVLFKNPVRINTDKPQRRFQIIVSIDSDSDLDSARDIIKAAVEAVENIDATHPVRVLAQEFKPSAVDFLVQWWAPARMKDEFTDEVIRGIKRALDKAGVDIAGAPATEIEIVNPEAPARPDGLQPAPRKETEPA